MAVLSLSYRAEFALAILAHSRGGGNSTGIVPAHTATSAGAVDAAEKIRKSLVLLPSVGSRECGHGSVRAVAAYLTVR